MPLQQLFTSRKQYNASTYVARPGKLFYDEATGYLRLGDGITPGGKVVGNLALAAVSLTAPINPYEGELWYNPNTKELWSYYNGQFRGTINAATTSTIGGIKAGPGVVVASDGTLSLDSTGIPFNFGDFYAFTNTGPSDGACLSSINLDQDVNIISNGTGTVNVVGEFNVHRTNSTVEDALAFNPIFSVKSDGQVTVLVPTADVSLGAVEIIGGTNGNYVPPKQPGVMLHVTGLFSTTSIASRIYNDGQNNLSAYVGRRYNGTAAAPTAVNAGDVIMRISAVGYGATTMPDFGSSRISFVAEENYTDTANGGRLEFYTNPIGGNTLTPVATMTNALGVWATKFTGPLTGNVNATAVTATNVVVGNTIRYDVTQNNGTATQLTSKSTTVVCNGRTGQITMSNSSIAKGEAITFTVTNSAVTAATDVPVVAIQTGATPNSYSISVTRVQVGSFNVTLLNSGSGPLTDTIVINFAIIKVA